jgi:hypothetical protein
VFISQKTTFFIVTAVKTSNLTKHNCVVPAIVNVELLRIILNNHFRNFTKHFLFLSPNVTDTQASEVYQRFIEFYFNGKEGLSHQDVYQIIEVSNKRRC